MKKLLSLLLAILMSLVLLPSVVLAEETVMIEGFDEDISEDEPNQQTVLSLDNLVLRISRILLGLNAMTIS